jgi:hypothetical protein
VRASICFLLARISRHKPSDGRLLFFVFAVLFEEFASILAALLAVENGLRCRFAHFEVDFFPLRFFCSVRFSGIA